MLALWKRESYTEILYKSSSWKRPESVRETPNEWDKMVPTHIVGNMGAPNWRNFDTEQQSWFSAAYQQSCFVSLPSSEVSKHEN